MAKILVVGLTVAAVLVIAEIKVHREPSQESRAISALRAVASAQRAYAAVTDHTNNAPFSETAALKRPRYERFATHGRIAMDK